MIFADIMSGPVAFLSLRVDYCLSTVSSLTSDSLKVMGTVVSDCCMSAAGGNGSLLKCSGKQSTISCGLVSVIPSCVRDGVSFGLPLPRAEFSCLQTFSG